MYPMPGVAHTILMIMRFVIYGALGCLMEVFWTGICSLKSKDFRLSSNTSLWMFFVYGMIALLEPVFRLVAPMPFFLRGILYAACIFAGEFASGSVLKRLQVCPWDYSGAKYHLKGLIRLDYLPVWIAAGLVFEWVFWTIV